MADNQSSVSSSVAPGDSVSSRGGKRAKPGKAERAARRAGQSGASGVSASASKASAFAGSGFSGPVPQVGAHPIVFPTGAGEPSREHEFVYDHDELATLTKEFAPRYMRNPRYAEFKAHSGVSDARFAKLTASSFLLGLAQQTVHAHVNMGLPQLDFSAVASSDVNLTSAQRAVVTQFGEFSEPALGTRYVLADYVNTVGRLVLAAKKICDGEPVTDVIERSWLPMSSNDKVTRLVVASLLNEFLSPMELRVLDTVLEDAVLSGDVPDAWTAIKSGLGDPPVQGEVDSRDRFDFLFKSYADVGQFTVAFTTAASSAVLEELGLGWNNPNAGHLDWAFGTKSVFSELVDQWSRLSASYGQFFSMGSGLSNRTVARGSLAQMSDVSTSDMVTVVKTHVALSAAGFSLVACFPAPGIFSGDLRRNVVVTTPLNVPQKATEFCLLDWK